MCENEFGTAEENRAGSAGYRPRLLMNKIKDEKSVSDLVIVVFHGGNEFDPLPSPNTVERYRMLCDMGADAVIAGHTHCPQGYEIYHGRPILYSMGNFLFRNLQKTNEKDAWYYGYFTILDITRSGISPKIIPYRFDTGGTKITVFEGAEKEKNDAIYRSFIRDHTRPFRLETIFQGLGAPTHLGAATAGKHSAVSRL